MFNISSRSEVIRITKIVGSIIILGLILTYGGFRSVDYIKGPSVEIFEPRDWQKVATSTIAIHGKVVRAQNIYINGNPLAIDEDGEFTYTIAIFRGINHISILTNDQFERSSETILQIIGM